MSYREGMLRTYPQIQTEPLRKSLTLGLMGLAGESGEFVDLVKKHLFHGKYLDREKALKELGDTRWYLEALAVAAREPEFSPYSNLSEDGLETETMALIFYVGKVIDHLALYIQGDDEYLLRLLKENSPSFGNYLRRLYLTISTAALTLSSTVEEVEALNLAKLRARYPEGFSFEAASARADEKAGA